MIREPYLEVLERLLAHVAEQKNGSDAQRLWRAAKDIFPSWFGEFCELVAGLPKGRRATPSDVDQMDLIFTRQADFHAARHLAGVESDPKFRDAIDDEAESKDVRSEAMFDDWSAVGQAFHEAAILLRILPLPMATQHPEILMTCQLCWHTGIRTRYGKYHCREHLAGADKTSYKEARRLLHWQDPSQPTGSNHSYVFLCWLEKIRQIPSGLEPLEPSDLLLLRLRRGEAVNVADLPRHQVDFRVLWHSLPLTREFLDSVDSTTPTDDAGRILQALDPVGKREAALHQALHAAIARDQRHLVEMLQLAEAWLEARAARNRAHGGSRSQSPRRASASERHIITLGGPMLTKRCFHFQVEFRKTGNSQT